MHRPDSVQSSAPAKQTEREGFQSQRSNTASTDSSDLCRVSCRVCVSVLRCRHCSHSFFDPWAFASGGFSARRAHEGCILCLRCLHGCHPSLDARTLACRSLKRTSQHRPLQREWCQREWCQRECQIKHTSRRDAVTAEASLACASCIAAILAATPGLLPVEASLLQLVVSWAASIAAILSLMPGLLPAEA